MLYAILCPICILVADLKKEEKGYIYEKNWSWLAYQWTVPDL